MKTTIRYCVLSWMTVTVALCATNVPAAAPPARSNILFILVDDMGYGDVACYGCPDTKTPTIDSLARQGVLFTNYYANGPECTPTRTALMTGRYQQRAGGLECAIGTGNVGRYDDAIRLCEKHQLGLPAEQNVLTQGLRAAGYAVVGFGKWHLGYEPQFGPIHHGFDRFFGPMGGCVDYFYHCEWDGVPMLYDDEKLVHREGYLTKLLTDAAVAFLDDYDQDRPFFLYLPYTCPHTPIQSPTEKPDKPRTKENWNEGSRETYAQMVEYMDGEIAKVLRTLKDKGLEEDTLVIFASDNGGTKLANNGPFSGYKGGCFEGGIRVPCIVRYPGVVPAGKTTDQPAITVDWTRSILRLVGQKPALPPDGIDILAHVAEDRPITKRSLFWRQRRGDLTWKAVRDGDMKYVWREKGGNHQEWLFDLKNDPAEKKNLAKTDPESFGRLKRLLADWEKETKAAR